MKISFKHSVCQIRVEFTDYEDRFFNSSVAFAISAHFNTYVRPVYVVGLTTHKMSVTSTTSSSGFDGNTNECAGPRGSRKLRHTSLASASVLVIQARYQSLSYAAMQYPFRAVIGILGVSRSTTVTLSFREIVEHEYSFTSMIPSFMGRMA